MWSPKSCLCVQIITLLIAWVLCESQVWLALLGINWLETRSYHATPLSSFHGFETCFQEGTSDFGKGVLISEEIRQLLNKVNAALPWWYTGWGASPLLSNKELPAMQEMQETWICSLGWEDPLEEEVATCSSIHTRKISWTEKPGGLWSMGSQRVVHS